jgi:hypothetical protein
MKMFALAALGFACGCAASLEHSNKGAAQPGRRLAVAHPLETFDEPTTPMTSTTHTQAPMPPMMPSKSMLQPASYDGPR